MNPGEGFLTEEWTYPSAVASAMPYNIHAVSVPIDALGMRPQDLRKILAEWDEEARGMKRWVSLCVATRYECYLLTRHAGRMLCILYPLVRIPLVSCVSSYHLACTS
jgi:hypothetical protein